MGLLHDLLDGFGAGKRLRGNLRGAEALLKEGRRGTATVVGIRVRRGKDDSPDQHEFALAYTGEGAARIRTGCRQNLGVLRGRVRLGMEVPIRHDGAGQAVIDAVALGADDDAVWGYKALGEPPAEGIEDDNVDLDKERGKADEVQLRVLGVEPFSPLGVATQNFDVRVRVEGAPDGPYETLVKRDRIPFYATHLAEPGTVVPGLVRRGKPDKVRIDWPAAAIADPGVGRPPAAVFASERSAGQVAAGD